MFLEKSSTGLVVNANLILCVCLILHQPVVAIGLASFLLSQDIEI